MEDIQQKFFNFDEPCPSNILNCEQIRKEYKDEVEKYKAQGICGGCVERSIKSKYITIIMSMVIR